MLRLDVGIILGPDPNPSGTELLRVGGAAVVSGRATVGGGGQFTGNTLPTAGAGVEVRYDSGAAQGILASFDRGATAYRALRYDALTHLFQLSGASVFGLASGGAWAGASDPGGTEPFRVNGAARVTGNVLLAGGKLQSVRSSDGYALTVLRRWNGVGAPFTGGADGPHLVVGSEDSTGDVIVGVASVEHARWLATGDTATATALQLRLNGAMKRVQIKAGNTLGASDNVCVLV